MSLVPQRLDPHSASENRVRVTEDRRSRTPSAQLAAQTFDVIFYAPYVAPLLVRDSGPPATGGAETQLWILARGLAARGYRVGLVCYQTSSALPESVEGVTLIQQLRTSDDGPPWRRGLASYVRNTARALTPVDAQVFVQRSAGRDTGVVGGFVRAKRRMFVYSSANVIDFDFERLETSRRDLRLFHLGVRLANKVVVQTQEQADLCRRKFGRAPVLIKSVAEAAEGPVRKPETFIWIGRSAPYKNPLAFLELAARMPEATFEMVGISGDDYATVERERAAAGISNLALIPPMPRTSLLARLDRAVAIVNTADYEGMPNIFLEGWARGVPALALKHDPDGVIERERLGGFAGGSLERLVDLARELWQGKLDQTELGLRCREYVRREHGLDGVLSRWIDALELSRDHPDMPDAARSG